MKNTSVVVVSIAAACVGLLDSLYLLAHRISGTEMTCGLTHGCGAVAASPYSVFLGIPLSVFGIIFYVGFVLLLAAEQFSFFTTIAKFFRVNPRAIMLMYTTVGAMFSLYFIYLQAFVILAWCQYCLLSAATTGILFLCAAWRYKNYLK